MAYTKEQTETPADGLLEVPAPWKWVDPKSIPVRTAKEAEKVRRDVLGMLGYPRRSSVDPFKELRRGTQELLKAGWVPWYDRTEAAGVRCRD